MIHFEIIAMFDKKYMKEIIDNKQLKLVTSNKFKLNEFQRFGLPFDATKGLDLKEVKGSSKEVVIYKAISAGENNIVEDTILEVEGQEIVDIRMKMSELDNYIGKEAFWTVSLSFMHNGYIFISQSKVSGFIKKPKESDLSNSFGFDPFFVPLQGNLNLLSLSELERIGVKDVFSARKKAVNNLINAEGDFSVIKRISIKDWDGEYQ